MEIVRNGAEWVINGWKWVKNGADYTINSMGKTSKEISGELKAFRKENGLASTGWKIFEVSRGKSISSKKWYDFPARQNGFMVV